MRASQNPEENDAIETKLNMADVPRRFDSATAGPTSANKKVGGRLLSPLTQPELEAPRLLFKAPIDNKAKIHARMRSALAEVHI